MLTQITVDEDSNIVFGLRRPLFPKRLVCLCLRLLHRPEPCSTAPAQFCIVVKRELPPRGIVL